MRVWVVQEAAEHEVPTGCGTFATPPLAGVVFRVRVQKLIENTASVNFELKSQPMTDAEAVPDVVLKAVNGLGDEVTLTGVWVRGTSNCPLNIDDWRELKRLLEWGINTIAGRTDPEVSEWTESAKTTEGSWTLVRNAELRKQ